MALCNPVVVAVAVEIISTVKELLYFKFVLLWVAYLIVDNPGALHDDLVVEGTVLHINLLSVSQQVIDLVNVDSVSRV